MFYFFFQVFFFKLQSAAPARPAAKCSNPPPFPANLFLGIEPIRIKTRTAAVRRCRNRRRRNRRSYLSLQPRVDSLIASFKFLTQSPHVCLLNITESSRSCGAELCDPVIHPFATILTPRSIVTTTSLRSRHLFRLCHFAAAPATQFHLTWYPPTHAFNMRSNLQHLFKSPAPSVNQRIWALAAVLAGSKSWISPRNHATSSPLINRRAATCTSTTNHCTAAAPAAVAEREHPRVCCSPCLLQ